MTRIVILLDKDERRALDRLAMHELRDPRWQVRFLIRKELERCGLLRAELTPTTEPAPEEPKPESG
jgi:hypothetical protein